MWTCDFVSEFGSIYWTDGTKNGCIKIVEKYMRKPQVRFQLVSEKNFRNSLNYFQIVRVHWASVFGGISVDVFHTEHQNEWHALQVLRERPDLYSTCRTDWMVFLSQNLPNHLHKKFETTPGRQRQFEGAGLTRLRTECTTSRTIITTFGNPGSKNIVHSEFGIQFQFDSFQRILQRNRASECVWIFRHRFILFGFVVQQN